MTHNELKSDRKPVSDRNPLVIAGGGIGGIFTAYEILKQAKRAGISLSVVLLADEISAPCTAGSHIVLELEGFFDEGGTSNAAIFNLLREGLNGLRQTIRDENIVCRLDMGGEIKSRDAGALHELVEEMIEKKVYTAKEIRQNSDDQIVRLPGYDHSVILDCIGQVNTPELLYALAAKIRALGGQVEIGRRYEGHARLADGSYRIDTNLGSYRTTYKPFLATGAEHQQTLPDFDFVTKVLYTMGIVLGPLEKADAVQIARTPMAFCDTNLEGDVIWGGLDCKGYFTIGCGDLESPFGKDALYQELKAMVEGLYPGLTQKYPPEISFGAMLVPENRMPIVGRLPDYDIAGGWAGMGIVAGYAAAQAYAQYIIEGNEEGLLVFENMQPGKFCSADKAHQAGSKISSAA